MVPRSNGCDTVVRLIARVPERLLVAAAVAVAVLLAVPNLESNPPLSYDEGYLLEAPHNLLKEGWYGVRIEDRNEVFDTHLSTGPTVLLPVWAMFVLLGEGVIQARIIPVLYSALAVAVGYFFARAYAGRLGGFAAALLLASALYPYSRSVLGEAPGLFWLLLGAVLWLHGLRRTGNWWLFLAGVTLGLAVLTKLALGPVILAGFGATWLGAAAGGRPLGWRVALAPLAAALAPLAAWYIFQVAVLGPEAVWARLITVTQYQGQMAYWRHLGGNWAAIANLIPGGLLPWVAPAVLVLFARALRGGFRSPEQTLLPALMAASLSYYLISVGWPRYGYWFAMLSALAVGSLAPVFLRELRRHAPFGVHRRWALAAAPLAVWAMLLLPQADWSIRNTGRSDESLAKTAGFVKQHIGPDDTAGSTENEVGFVSGMRFTYPPPFVATVSKETVRDSYDWTWGKTEWVVTGVIGHSLGADKVLERSQRFVERFSSGPYRVFQRYPGSAPLPGWVWNTTGASPTPSISSGRVGQTFVAPYSVVTEVRVLLAGEGRANNAAVRLRIYDSPARGRMLSRAEIPGRDIVQNRWYTFDVGKLHVTKGQQYYLELVSRPEPGEAAVTAWFNATVDYYADGRWWQDGVAQDGDLYFGILGHNNARLSVRNVGAEALWLGGVGP